MSSIPVEVFAPVDVQCERLIKRFRNGEITEIDLTSALFGLSVGFLHARGNSAVEMHQHLDVILIDGVKEAAAIVDAILNPSSDESN